MKAAWLVLGIIGGGLLLALVWLIASYNRFVALRQHIRESWADIDVELKRRHDLIPNLVETVKGYAAHERGVFEEIARLRQLAMQHMGGAGEESDNHGAANAGELGRDESKLMKAVGRLIAVAEAYPALKSDRNFLQLQEELADTEDRIAASRRFMNANVREYTQLREQFPTNLVANAFNFGGQKYFEIENDAERVVPRVRLRDM